MKKITVLSCAVLMMLVGCQKEPTLEELRTDIQASVQAAKIAEREGRDLLADYMQAEAELAREPDSAGLRKNVERAKEKLDDAMARMEKYADKANADMLKYKELEAKNADGGKGK